ncbi:MAG: hypothetical protein ABEH38_05375 [Flavobacteriales bacterium]
MLRKALSREKSFFFLVNLLHLFPLFSGKFFPILDAPSHLYNARLINDLLLGENELVHRFFSLNGDPVPNWTGHFILAVLKWIMPSFLAEKLLILSYALGLAYAFRYLLRATPNGRPLLAYLVLPFIYHNLFFVGFYNFCLGLTFLFLSLGYYQKSRAIGFKVKRMGVLFLLFLLTYFSHLFPFAALLLILGTENIYTLVHRLFVERSPQGASFRATAKRGGKLFLCLLPPLLLMAFYFLKRPIIGEGDYLAMDELLTRLGRLDALIWLNTPHEATYTSILNYALIAFLLIGVYERIKFCSRSFQGKANTDQMPFRKRLFQRSDHWLIAALVLLLFYFHFPNSNGEAGVITSRFELLFYLFALLWVSTLKFPKWAIVSMISVLLFTTFSLNAFYYSELVPLQRTAANCYQLSKELEPQSLVLPINRSNNWMHHHFVDYLGIEGSSVVLENYEADKSYFPVKWKEEMPKPLFGPLFRSELSCKYWPGDPNAPSRPIDYVLLLGGKKELQPCQKKADSILHNSYQKLRQEGDAALYRFKGKD